jgi:glycosyltransferase involved in cell wall biosynthesis
MKILHVDTGKSWRGGQQQVFYLHRELSSEGIESLLVCSAGGALAERARVAGLAVEELPLRGEWDLASAWRIARLLTHGGFSHLHLHSSHGHGIGVLSSAMARFPNVIVTRRVDFPVRGHLGNRWKYGARVRRFVAISRIIRGELLKFGVPDEKIRLIPSGVDPDRSSPGSGESFRRELGLAEGQPLVGAVGHLADHKGHRYFIEAMPRIAESFPDARFVLVGDGELMEPLKRKAADLGLGEHLVFTGFRRDVDPIMDALDVFVMPSHMEGLGTIVMDALAARKAVVAAEAGGIPEIVEDGANGLLVPPKTVAPLADAVSRLLRDGELRRRLGEAGRRTVIERFSARAMAMGNLALYRELDAS